MLTIFLDQCILLILVWDILGSVHSVDLGLRSVNCQPYLEIYFGE